MNFVWFIRKLGSVWLEPNVHRFRIHTLAEERTFSECNAPQPPSSLCPGLESNQHAISRTTPSRWRVYQFHHPGRCVHERVALMHVKTARLGNHGSNSRVKGRSPPSTTRAHIG